MQPKVKLVANIRIMNVCLLNILTIITPLFHWSYCHKERGIDKNRRTHLLTKGRLLQKTMMSFCFNNKLQKTANPMVGNYERRRSPNKSEFGKNTQCVDVGRFVSCVERWRSLSCWVHSHPSFCSLFNNIAHHWKSRVR